jgi:hypothetical protein
MQNGMAELVRNNQLIPTADALQKESWDRNDWPLGWTGVAPWSYKAVCINPHHWKCAEPSFASLQCAKQSRFLERKIALQSLLKRSELFKRVHSQSVDMPLHRGFSLFAVSFN